MMLAYGVTTETMQHSRGAPSGNLFLPLLLGAPVKGASGPLSCVVRLLSSVPVPLTSTWKARPWLLVQAAMKAQTEQEVRRGELEGRGLGPPGKLWGRNVWGGRPLPTSLELSFLPHPS